MTRIEDQGLIDRHSPVVAVVVGILDAVVPRPLPPDPWTLSPNLWNLPISVLADRGQRTTLLVPLHDIKADQPAFDTAATAVQLCRDEPTAGLVGARRRRCRGAQE